MTKCPSLANGMAARRHPINENQIRSGVELVVLRLREMRAGKTDDGIWQHGQQRIVVDGCRHVLACRSRRSIDLGRGLRRQKRARAGAHVNRHANRIAAHETAAERSGIDPAGGAHAAR